MALVGRPNVGKSSLLNRVAKDERSVVDSVAGTTVDPVDSIVTLGGEEWRFVDTAGLRRKVNTASGTEYYASLRTEAAIQAAEVAVVLLAADEVISEQDQRVITQVVESGRALVIAFNKWDTLDEDRHFQLEKEIERELARVKWATRVNISAATGRGVNKLAEHLRAALASWESRVPTAELNTYVRALVQETPPPARGGRAPKIKYVTQADIRPPRFVVFSTGFLEAGYRRFLERKLRERGASRARRSRCRSRSARAGGTIGRRADPGFVARVPGNRQPHGLGLRRPRAVRARPRRCARALGHHIHRPTSRVSAVTSTERTMIVSRSTPSATAMPSWVTNVKGSVPSTANVAASTSPADVITPPVADSPIRAARRVPWSNASSRTRVIRKML